MWQGHLLSGGPREVEQQSQPLLRKAFVSGFSSFRCFASEGKNEDEETKRSAAAAADDLKSLTVKELKVLLAKYSLPLSGKKADLVERLLSCPDFDEEVKAREELAKKTVLKAAMNEHEAFREETEEEILVDKQVEEMASPDEITPIADIEEDANVEIQIPGASKEYCWLELTDLPKAVFPADIRRFLSDNDVVPVKGESFGVKLNESLHIASWFIPMKDQRHQLEGLKKLRNKKLGLLQVSARQLTLTQATNLLPEMERVLPEGEEYVSLTNVPAETTLYDVKDFFRGYNILCGSSGIEELKENQFSSRSFNYVPGEQETKRFLIRFTSSTEAYNAVQFKSHRPFFDRRAMVGLMFTTSNNLAKY
jgi:hypothetical protein